MLNIRSMEVAVGIFVAAGLAALLMLAMKVSNLSAFSEGAGYTLTAAFDNIGGLKVRSPVRIGGVRIGRVTAISYDEHTYQAVVTMTIQDKYNRLPTDTHASIYTSGLLGEQYIGLEPGASEKFLANGDQIKQTQSALVLEQLIGQFLFSKAAEGGQK
jgi:phospholipid/cholesterol/gamma-HCH transport system substrate-binding protein